MASASRGNCLGSFVCSIESPRASVSAGDRRAPRGKARRTPPEIATQPSEIRSTCPCRRFPPFGPGDRKPRWIQPSYSSTPRDKYQSSCSSSRSTSCPERHWEICVLLTNGSEYIGATGECTVARSGVDKPVVISHRRPVPVRRTGLANYVPHVHCLHNSLSYL